MVGCEGIFGTEGLAGPESGGLPAPRVGGFGFAPRQMFVEEAIETEGDAIRFRLAVRVWTDSLGGCASTAEVLLVREGAADPIRARAGLSFRPDSSRGATSPSVESTDPPGCERGLFRDSVLVQVEKGAVGPYSVRAFLLDAQGRLGDGAQGVFRLRQGAGEPPRLTSVTASADTIDGDDPPETLTFWAEASDPDGRSNLEAVEVRPPSPGEWLPVHDDGVTHGDERAGDGRYTVRFDLPDRQDPGEQIFEFRAVDRVGLESAIVRKTVVVE